MSPIPLTPAEHAEVLRQMPTDGPVYLTVEGDRMVGQLTGDAYLSTPSRFVEATGPCPVMIDGKHPVEHDGATCWHCDGTGRKRAELRAHCPQHAVCERGVQVFAHATIEVLPVVDHHTSPDLCPRANYIEVAAGISQMIGTAHYVEFVPPGTWNWLMTLTLDPLPVPGRDWIVVLDGLVLASP